MNQWLNSMMHPYKLSFWSVYRTNVTVTIDIFIYVFFPTSWLFLLSVHSNIDIRAVSGTRLLSYAADIYMLFMLIDYEHETRDRQREFMPTETTTVNDTKCLCQHVFNEYFVPKQFNSRQLIR